MSEEQVDKKTTDAVTQSDVAVIGEAPAFAMASVYQTEAHSTNILFENAIATQQRQNTLSLAAANMGLLQIYGLDVAAAGAGSEKIAQSGFPDDLSTMATLVALAQALRSQP